MRIRVFTVGAIIVALAGGFLAVRARGGAPTAETQLAQPSPVPVTVVAAQPGDVVASVSATGTVASLREARVASTLSGIVAEVFVSEGQRVPLGAPLMRLRSDQLAATESQARAGAAQASAALDLADASVQRMRELYQTGAVSRQELDAAEAQFAAALAQLDLTRAALAGAQIQLRDATVTAPFAGTIIQRSVEPGEAVSPVVPSFVLAQMDNVYVELAVPERHRAALRPGLTAAITVDSLPGRIFTGRIADISPGASAANRSFVVKVRVPNHARMLQTGVFARGTIVTGTRAGVLQIAERAVLTTAGGPVIFVVQAGRAVRRTVTLGDRQDGRVEATSGVRPGELVVVEGQEGLTDNQAVAPQPPQR